MKRTCLLLILCFLLILTGCGKAEPRHEPALPQETPPAEVTELLQEEVSEESFPVPENATAAADGVRLLVGYDEEGKPLYGETLKAGQPIKVHTLGTKICLIETGSGKGTVPRWEVLLYGEAAYRSWKGYAAKGALLCSDWEMQNESRILKKKTKVTVLFGTEDWLYVEMNGEYLFTGRADVTEIRELLTKPPEEDETDDWTPPMY